MAVPLAVTEVAACIVRDENGRVLVAERTARQMAAGFWELPGGKIEPGETAMQAAARELREEVGVVAGELRPWLAYDHVFATRRLRLRFFLAESWHGAAQGREGQRLAWIDPAAPAVAPLLASNHRVLRALALPPCYVATSAVQGGGPSGFLARLPRLLAAGIRLIAVCEPHLAPDQRIALARRIMAVAEPYGARVLLAGSCLEARRAGVSGVHCGASELRRLAGRPPVDLWVASCHDAADLQRAAELGADAAILSPILPCGSHPPRAPIGWDGLRRLAAAAPMPIYARGGMTTDLASAARACGAWGIAISEPAFMAQHGAPRMAHSV